MLFWVLSRPQLSCYQAVQAWSFRCCWMCWSDQLQGEKLGSLWATTWHQPTTTLWHCDMGWRCHWLDLAHHTRVDLAMKQSCMHSELDTGFVLQNTDEFVQDQIRKWLHLGWWTLLSDMAANNFSRLQFKSQSWNGKNSFSQTRSFLKANKQTDIYHWSKVWPGNYGTGSCLESVTKSFGLLGTDYLDLLLLHWPGASKEKVCLIFIWVYNWPDCSFRLKVLGARWSCYLMRTRCGL